MADPKPKLRKVSKADSAEQIGKQWKQWYKDGTATYRDDQWMYSEGPNSRPGAVPSVVRDRGLGPTGTRDSFSGTNKRDPRTPSAAEVVAPRKATTGTGAAVVNSLATYGTNIVNAFRKAPTPPVPENMSPVTLRRVNLQNSRNEVARRARTADLAADRTLDANAAAAVRTANFATGVNAVNGVNAQEEQINNEVANRQAQLNASIEGGNVQMRNNYRNDQVGMRIANQRESSQNLANFADKYMGVQNEKSRAQLEMDKFGIASQLFKESGVFDRFMDEQKKKGNTDPTGIKKQYGVFSTGGMLRKLKR